MQKRIFAASIILFLTACGGDESTPNTPAPPNPTPTQPTNSPPTAAITIAPVTVYLDERFEIELEPVPFEDSDGDAITITLGPDGEVPEWFTYNSANNSFEGTPVDTEPQTIDLMLVGGDGNDIATIDFELIVEPRANKFFAFQPNAFPRMIDFMQLAVDEAANFDPTPQVVTTAYPFDADNDGDLDLLVTALKFVDRQIDGVNYAGPAFERTFIFRNEDGIFDNATAEFVGTNRLQIGGGLIYGIVKDDFNGDGIEDIVMQPTREDGRAVEADWWVPALSLVSNEDSTYDIEPVPLPETIGILNYTDLFANGEKVIWKPDFETDFEPFDGGGVAYRNGRWVTIDNVPNVDNGSQSFLLDSNGNADVNGTEAGVIFFNTPAVSVAHLDGGIDASFGGTNRNDFAAYLLRLRNGTWRLVDETASFGINAETAPFETGNDPINAGNDATTVEIFDFQTATYAGQFFERACTIEVEPNRPVAINRILTRRLPDNYTRGSTIFASDITFTQIYVGTEIRNGQPQIFNLGFEEELNGFNIECRDLNGDGFDDVITQSGLFPNNDAPNVYLNNGMGSFTRLTEDFFPAAPDEWQVDNEGTFAVIDDFDGDGINDYLHILGNLVVLNNHNEDGIVWRYYKGREPLTN